MKILAIDPGTEQSAFVAWDTGKDDFIPTSDIGDSRGLISNHEFYYCIYSILNAIKPDQVVIEMVQSYGMAVGRSTFQTVLFVGRLVGKIDMYSNSCAKILVKYYGRPTIKAQVGGKTDAQIRASLRLRYGEAKKGEKLEGVKKDIWSALALAAALTERPHLKEW
jgi:hypothetical protein